MKSLILFLALIVAYSAFAADSYCNGQAKKDGTFGMKTFYPNGQVVWDGSNVHYPNGQVVSDAFGLYYPNGNIVHDNWGAYYPGGNDIADHFSCYLESGKEVTCKNNFRAMGTLSNGKVSILYDRSFKKVKSLHYSLSLDGVRVRFEVVSSQVKNIKARCL